jgi:NitT/TauT family transport system ATP-binding protein
VIVISPRPGTIARDLAIELPRPRTLEVCETPQFHAHVAEIRRIFFGYGVI